ncbi:glycosyltransferase family 4 protein [Aureimonas leprariae]|uniref:glycosyltransferase family 4 protein n=1 Tax=Plantimonas leprariae TaxID=2615207 RepID=UPI002484625E|nr:glycosyltransferase family 4 protein [Aureimonas leprariae]
MPDASPSKPKLVFLATEDWFFASHFLPMVRAGRDAGLDVVVAARFARHRDRIEAAGARTVPLDMERGGGWLLGPLRAFLRTLRLLRAEQPAIVHAISLRAVLLGGLARRLSGGGPTVQAITGLGVVGADEGWRGRLARRLFRHLLRRTFAPKGAAFLFENEEDARWLGLDRTMPDAVFVPGAGVDPAAYPQTPLPAGRTLRVALVSRMLWSKGVDVAVEAVRRARRGGADVTLSLYGAPDPANPRAIPEADLRRWGTEDGIEWHGPTSDVAGVWREHHVACLPSRGGEGLPRALLEAACCGRPIVATMVPGCTALVRDGKDGLLVPPGDPEALAAAFAQLAADRPLAGAMGDAAARRVREGFTEDHVAAIVEALYRRLLGQPPQPAATISRTSGATLVP